MAAFQWLGGLKGAGKGWGAWRAAGKTVLAWSACTSGSAWQGGVWCSSRSSLPTWHMHPAPPQSPAFFLAPCLYQAYRNTVTIPRHWSQKRKYLQGKRGLEKPPFKLPEFIEATGIGAERGNEGGSALKVLEGSWLREVAVGAIGSGAACQALERSQPWQTTGQCQQHHARRQFGLWAAREVLLWL